ncbi:MAG: PAS domain S-box protein [Gallionella sp.]|nr:PAS domain S-box protein [Gallionella sp.]
MELTTQHHLTSMLKQLGVAALYALSLYIGELYFEGEDITGYFEPASGLALAALLIGGKRYVWGVLLGAILINAISANSFGVAVTIASGDALQAFCGAWLLTREGHGFDLHLQSLRAYLRLILLGGCTSIVIGALAVNSALLFSRLLAPENYFHSLAQWWMSDTLGVILIAPLILVWWKPKNNQREAGKMAEAVLLLGLTILVGQAVFLGWRHDAIGEFAKGYWMFLLTTWVAIRFGTRETVVILVMIAAYALLGATRGVGYFADDIAQTHLVNYWLYMVTLSMVGMALATHFTERKQIEAALRNRTGELVLHNHIFKQVSLGMPLCEILESLARQVEKQNPGMLCSILLPDEDGKPLRYGAAPGLSDFCNQPIKGGGERVLGTFAIYHHKPAQPSDTEIALIEHYAGLAAQVIERVRNRDDLCLKNLALNAAANAIVITDRNSKIEWVNQAFGKLTGYSVAEAIGHYPKELVKSGKHSQTFYQELWQTIISGKVWHGEIINRRKDGSLYHEEMTITPVANEHGEITHFVAVKQDITERVNAGLVLRQYKLVIDTVNDGFWMVDAMGNLLEANAVYAKISGYQVDELVNMHVCQLEAIEQSVEEVRAHIEKVIAQGCVRFETRHRHKDGHEIDVEVSATFMVESQQFFVFIRDITERKCAEIALRESEANQHAILNNSPYMAWLKDPDGRYLKVNKTYADYARLKDARQIIGKTDFDLWPRKLAEKYRADDAEVMALRQQKHIEEPSLDGDTMHWVETFKTPVIDQGGNVLGTTGFAHDITERKQAEAELRIVAATFESKDGMMVTDAENVILRVNHAFTEITGYTAEEAIGRTPGMLKSDRHDAAFYAAMWKSIRSTGSWHGEIWNQHKNDKVYPAQFTITAVKENNGEVTHYVATLRDITERKAAEEQIYNLAFYDSLTRLPNRRLLNDRLGQTMAASRRSSHYGALMFLDLDNFKPLNDTHGHGTGDLLLIEVAHRLTGCVRESDTVARFGGDEFVVMLSELVEDKAESTAQAGIVAEKIRTTLAKPYLLKIQQEGKAETAVGHRCAASIGVVVFNSEASAEDIIKWADMAMYQAKEGGRNLIRFYRSEQRRGLDEMQ